MLSRSNLHTGIDKARLLFVENGLGYLERDVMERPRLRERALFALEGYQYQHLRNRDLRGPGFKENRGGLSRRSSQNLESKKVTVKPKRGVQVVNMKDDLGKSHHCTHF